MGFFSSRKETVKQATTALGSKAYRALSQIALAGDGEETLRAIQTKTAELFECGEISIGLLEKGVGAGEVSWNLEIVSGKHKGVNLNDSDTRRMPALKPGSFILSSDQGSEDVQFKTIALSYLHGRVYGCQTSKGRIALHENPTQEDDLGEGMLSALVVPLSYESHLNVVPETIKVGVLVLYNTPIREDSSEIVENFGKLVARHFTFASLNHKDPLMGLLSETETEGAVNRQSNLWKLYKSKFQGGFVFGQVDSLTHYRKTVENETDLGSEMVAQFVNDILRGIGQCIAARSLQFPIDEKTVYAAGVPGRLGSSGFVVVLPMLEEDDLVKFGRALQNDVKAYKFPSENLLESGDITVSVRVLPCQDLRKSQTEWMVIRDEASVLYREQSQARGTSDLAEHTETVKVMVEGKWLQFDDWKENRRLRLAEQAKKAAEAKRPATRQVKSQGPQGRPGPRPSGAPRPINGPGPRPQGNRPPSRPLGPRPNGPRPTGGAPGTGRPLGQRPLGNRPRGRRRPEG